MSSVIRLLLVEITVSCTSFRRRITVVKGMDEDKFVSFYI